MMHSKHMVLTSKWHHPSGVFHLPPIQLVGVREFLAFDRFEVTHCCEITPSRWLVPVCVEYEWAEGTDLEFIEECEADWMCLDWGGCYIWASDVERMPLHSALYVPEKEGREAILDAFSEGYRCNSPPPAPPGLTVGAIGTTSGRKVSRHYHQIRRRRAA